MRTLPTVAAVGVAAVVVIAGCAVSGVPATSVQPHERVIASGFDRPTQIVDGPDGLLLVAQIAGDENAGTGQVVALDPSTGARRIVLRGLDKPTGVLWSGDELWVMVRRGIIHAHWPAGTASPGSLDVVIDDLAYNGRSEGTLTPLGDGRFLYETSGALVDGTIVEGSGTVWVFDPRSMSSRPVAVGVKNGYAHAVLADGRIITTDIGDNIANPPVEELDITDSSGIADLGWPRCPGDHACAGVVRPTAVFAPSTTPTGVAVVGDTIYVTLFVTGQLMSVSIHGWKPGDGPIEPVEVLGGLKGPHTVLARRDGTLWISEYETGQILALTP